MRNDYTMNEAATALCVWEAVLESKQHETVAAHFGGAVAAREAAVHFGCAIEAGYAAAKYASGLEGDVFDERVADAFGGTFDWGVVPALVAGWVESDFTLTTPDICLQLRGLLLPEKTWAVVWKRSGRRPLSDTRVVVVKARDEEEARKGVTAGIREEAYPADFVIMAAQEVEI